MATSSDGRFRYRTSVFAITGTDFASAGTEIRYTTGRYRLPKLLYKGTGTKKYSTGTVTGFLKSTGIVHHKLRVKI